MNRLCRIKKNNRETNLGSAEFDHGRKPETIGFSSSKLRDSLAGEFLAVCVNMLKKHGLSVQQILQLVREATKRDDEIPATTSLFQDVSRLGQLASEWAENPSYVDSDGRPKVLSISGKSPSFYSLARKYFLGRPVAEILQLGYRTRVLEPIGSDRVGHLGTCVLLTGNPLMLLGHTVRSIKWFLGTARYNAQAQRSVVSSWPERQTFAELPEDEFRKFVDFMREPIVNLTEMSNRWLMGRSASGKSQRGKKITMGVQAYVFRDT